MKKMLALLLAVMMLFALAACGGTDEQPSDTTPADTSETTETPAATNKDLPDGDYEEMGDGIVYVSTAGGTTEDGNIPVHYVASDTILDQIGINSEGVNGAALSYIYLDGMLVDKQQMGDYQGVIDLTGDQLAAGIHKVEVVQYENDDPTGAMTLYKAMSFEIKES